MISRAYNKNIASGRGILYFSILFAFIIRVLYYLNSDISYIEPNQGSFLWNQISVFFSDPLVSLVSSSACVIIISLLLSLINTKNLLLRKRSLLPISLSLLLFSSHPVFLSMNQYYIGALFIVFAIITLFSSYQSTRGQIATANVSFILAIGSLFVPNLLFYVIIFWIGLRIMWCFSFKSFLASIIGLIIVYIPILSLSLYNDGDFFSSITLAPIIDEIRNIPIINFTSFNWVLSILAILILLITSISSYLERHRDKIKIRNFILFLSILSFFTLVFYSTVNIDTTTHYFILLISGSLILSHYFALGESKGVEILFYTLFIFYLICCYITFLY